MIYYRITGYTPFVGEECDFYFATNHRNNNTLYDFMVECAESTGNEWYDEQTLIENDMTEDEYYAECYAISEEISEEEYYENCPWERDKGVKA